MTVIFVSMVRVLPDFRTISGVLGTLELRAARPRLCNTVAGAVPAAHGRRQRRSGMKPTDRPPIPPLSLAAGGSDDRIAVVSRIRALPQRTQRLFGELGGPARSR